MALSPEQRDSRPGKAVLNWLGTDGARRPKLEEAPVFSNEAGEPVKDFRPSWEIARRRAGITDLHFHDLRGKYASQLVERGGPLSQARDLLGHASIVTTERYDQQTFKALEAAARLLEDGGSFNFLPTCEERPATVTQTSGLAS